MQKAAARSVATSLATALSLVTLSLAPSSVALGAPDGAGTTTPAKPADKGGPSAGGAGDSVSEPAMPTELAPIRDRLLEVLKIPTAEEQWLAASRYATEREPAELAQLLAWPGAEKAESNTEATAWQQLAIRLVVDQGPEGRAACIQQLFATKPEQRCGRCLFTALAALWDTRGRVEKALTDRIDAGAVDMDMAIDILCVHGTEKAVPAIIRLLQKGNVANTFFTWHAQHALDCICGRDPNPDALVQPLIVESTRTLPYWPSEGFARHRDVILSLGAARNGGSVPLLKQILALSAQNDELLDWCCTALERVGNPAAQSVLADECKKAVESTARMTLVLNAVMKLDPKKVRPELLFQLVAVGKECYRRAFPHWELPGKALNTLLGENFGPDYDKLQVCVQARMRDEADERAEADAAPDSQDK